MKRQVVIDTLRLAYQYLGKAVADNSMPNCAIPVEQAFERIGDVLEEIEKEQIETPPRPVRPSVFEFAKAMEAKLEENDYKGGWGANKCTLEYLEYRLLEEVEEYFTIRVKGGIESYFNIEPELVDIANFSMMLYHRHLNNEHLLV